MAGQSGNLCPVRAVPDAHGLVAAGAGQPLAVRAEEHAADFLRVTVDREQDFPGGQVPDMHRPIRPRGGKPAAVRMESHAGDPWTVLVQLKELAAAVHSPDADDPVGAR